VDADRAAQFANNMRTALTDLHSHLTNDAWLLTQAPNHAIQLFKDYDAAKASALAALACVKKRIDAALAAGAAAAVSCPTRTRYAEVAATIDGMEAEREALGPAAEARHSEVLAAADKAEQARRAAESAASAARDDLKNLYGARRDSLVERMAQLTNIDTLGFARHPYAHPENPSNPVVTLIAAQAVIPSLVLYGKVYFGTRAAKNYDYITADSAKPITTLAQLEDLVDALMGKPPTDDVTAERG
jgi:hypothetical protein